MFIFRENYLVNEFSTNAQIFSRLESNGSFLCHVGSTPAGKLLWYSLVQDNIICDSHFIVSLLRKLRHCHFRTRIIRKKEFFCTLGVWDITSFYLIINLYTFIVFSFLLLLCRSSSFFPLLVFLHPVMFSYFPPSTLSNLTFSFAHFSHLKGQNWLNEVTAQSMSLCISHFNFGNH